MSKDDGGPAFPTGEVWPSGSHVQGISVRDHFMAAALQGLCANPAMVDTLPDSGAVHLWLVQHALRLADVALAERAK